MKNRITLSKSNCIYLLIFAILSIFLFNNLSIFAQFPSDTNYLPGVITCTFKSSVIDPNYFCCAPKTKNNHDKALTNNYITPNNSLITHPGIVDYLNNNYATLEPMWSNCYDPCYHRYEVTQWGDTLHFDFWTKYIIHFPDTISPVMFAYGLATLDLNAVDYVYPFAKNNHYEAWAQPNDEKYNYQKSIYNSYNTDCINIEQAWQITTGSNDIHMGVLDRGFNVSHPDFHHYTTLPANEYHNYIDPIDYVPQPSTLSTTAEHGQFIAGIMGALTNNKNPDGTKYVGIAGIAGGNWLNTSPRTGCLLYLGQIQDANSFYSIPAEITAIDDWTSFENCWDRVRVINMSYGSPMQKTSGDASYDRYQAYARAYRRGTVLVNAKQEDKGGGNNINTDPDEYGRTNFPNGWNDEWFIGVTSYYLTDDCLCHWSSWGGNNKIMAPGAGQEVFSLTTNNDYAYVGGINPPNFNFGGNSFAAPHVSGTAALILSADINKTNTNCLLNDDVVGLIEGTGIKSNHYVTSTDYNSGIQQQEIPYDPFCGFGRLNAGGAVSKANSVKRSYIDLSTLTPTEYANMVSSNEIVNTEVDPANFFSNFIINKTESTDPFDANLNSYNYRWQRIKVSVKITLSSTDLGPGQKLAHAWGIGKAHNIINHFGGTGHIPDSKGWDPGVVAYENYGTYGGELEYLWSSQTPYAHVEPTSIDVSNNSFVIYTYCYKMSLYNKGNNYIPPDTWYPIAPRNTSLSYGFITEPISTRVDDLSSSDTYSIDNIYPNPATDKIKIKFNIIESDYYIIKITDQIGRDLIKPINTGTIVSGVHESDLDIYSLSNGLYFCQIISGTKGKSTCKPFIVQK